MATQSLPHHHNQRHLRHQQSPNPNLNLNLKAKIKSHLKVQLELEGVPIGVRLLLRLHFLVLPRLQPNNPQEAGPHPLHRQESQRQRGHRRLLQRILKSEWRSLPIQPLQQRALPSLQGKQKLQPRRKLQPLLQLPVQSTPPR